ncbi:MAG TPA: hypothetical protein VEA37_09480 [Flavobacterium sp.]|nr:hypothetical protein [Flavobacterium sp.]
MKTLTRNFYEQLAGPLGTVFNIDTSILTGAVEKIQENTFEIISRENRSAIVCGDTLINLLTGKKSIQTLKFK